MIWRMNRKKKIRGKTKKRREKDKRRKTTIYKIGNVKWSKRKCNRNRKALSTFAGTKQKKTQRKTKNNKECVVKKSKGGRRDRKIELL